MAYLPLQAGGRRRRRPSESGRRDQAPATPMHSEERRAIFGHLRQEFGIHSLEDQLGAKAEVILSALARASDLTMRGVRGIIAEAAFITEVITPGPTSRWQDATPPGNHSFDFLLRDPAGQVRVQIKLQRQKEHRPLTASEILRSYGFPPDMSVVETQRTRRGARLLRREHPSLPVWGIRPPRCLSAPLNRQLDRFPVYSRELAPPRPQLPDRMMKYQPVSAKESDGWTPDFERCVSWFRSGDRRRIRPGYGEPSGC